MRMLFPIIKSKSKKGAFTLIELLVVCVVILILAALIFPAIKAFQERAEGAICANNMRQLGTALFAWRLDHSGWFPPGYPVAPTKITGANVQPGAELQPGISEIRFSPYLVPEYLAAMPVCPGLRQTSEGKKYFPDTKKRMQALQGGYGINAVLLQYPINAMPWPTWPSWVPFPTGGGARMPFLLEVAPYASASWSFEHQYDAIHGLDTIYVKGRNHGGKDHTILNYMFLDGHIQAIAQNDNRNVEDSKKTWVYPANPNGAFEGYNQFGRLMQHRQISDNEFKMFYPQYYPPKP